MNISVKICDWCDTCVYESEYEIIDGYITCVMCIEEKEEKEGRDSEISSRPVGDIQSLESQPHSK